MLARKPCLTKNQEKEIVRLSRHYIAEGMTAIQKDLDALWLMAIASTFEVEPEASRENDTPYNADPSLGSRLYVQTR